MNLINKKFFLNSFYIKYRIYSGFLVFSFLNFDNIIYNNLNLYFLKKNINVCFIKNSLVINLLPLSIHKSVSKSNIYLFSFNLFYSLNIYCNLPLIKKIFFFKFAYIKNNYYNRYSIYFIYILFNNNVYLYIVGFIKKILKKILFLLKFFLKLNNFKNSNKSNMSVKEVLNLIENLTLLEVNELIKSFEEKYNISTSQNDFLNNNKEILKEKKLYSLYLSNIGNNKISVIKIIREINNLGLKESKDLVDSAPVLIKENIEFDFAESLKKRFEELGSIIEIK